jgi:hypothetical protein
MKKVKFTATKLHEAYHSGAFSFSDGEIKEIPDEEAERLIETFPENFTLVAGDEPEAKMVSERKTKMIRGKKDK